MKNSSPFLDIMSFVAEEARPEIFETATAPSSPFLSLYELEGTEGIIDPQAREYAVLLNELYSEEFDEALVDVVSEAAAIYDARFGHEQEEPQTAGYQAERLLTQHFAPLVAETEARFAYLAKELGQRDVHSLTENELEAVIERYQPAVELAPSFENFLGKLVKKVAGGIVKVGKMGLGAVAKLGIGPIFAKIAGFAVPWITKVIELLIGKLPTHLQPYAKKLAERLPFLKEIEETYEHSPEGGEGGEVAQLQYELNQHIANLLFAHDEVEQDLEIAQVLTEAQVPDVYPLAELDRARDQFITNLQNLKEGEDPTPHLEEFIPAIIPVLKMAFSLGARNWVVGKLSSLIAKLIQKFIDPQYAPALAKAIVDVGLRSMHLETTGEDESRADASALAATVEETVRRVVALPEVVLNDPELFEGFALEAFEQAAAANLPPVLPEDTYRRRPDLAEARKLRGAWGMMGRGGRRRCKKFTRRIRTRLTPHQVASLETFDGASLQEFLEESLGVAPGEEVEAFVHLYESIPGTRLPDVARMDESTPGLGAPAGYHQFHPLTSEAAGLLLGEPDLSHEAEFYYPVDRFSPEVGQRFYYLEVPGKKPLTAPGPNGRPTARRPSRVKLVLDFPKNEIRVYLLLSEVRSQEIAVKLRQHAHTGAVSARLQKIVRRGLGRALTGRYGRLKIIDESVAPGQYRSAIQRLPSLLLQVFLGHLKEWVLKGLHDYLKQQPQAFIKAAEDMADGVTVLVTLGNPPGFPQLRQALKSKAITPGSLKMSGGAPTVKVTVTSGHNDE